jgi:hypothetical protein
MPAHIYCVAYSFLIFHFGDDEDAAQQARHRLEGWRQGFRLDKKLQLKFERDEPEAKREAAPVQALSASKGSAKPKAAPKAKPKSAREADSKPGSGSAVSSEIRLIVRLDFSDHEKLSHQRWLDRIPIEDPFKGAKPKVVRSGDPEFATTEELFDSLD